MSIICYVSDYNERPTKEDNEEVEIVAYVPGEGLYPYVDFDGSTWNYATPAKEPVKWIMPPEKAIPVLIREGWFFTAEGDLKGDIHRKISIPHYYFPFFGTELYEAPPPFGIKELQCIVEEK